MVWLSLPNACASPAARFRSAFVRRLVHALLGSPHQKDEVRHVLNAPESKKAESACLRSGNDLGLWNSPQDVDDPADNRHRHESIACGWKGSRLRLWTIVKDENCLRKKWRSCHNPGYSSPGRKDSRHTDEEQRGNVQRNSSTEGGHCTRRWRSRARTHDGLCHSEQCEAGCGMILTVPRKARGRQRGAHYQADAANLPRPILRWPRSQKGSEQAE